MRQKIYTLSVIMIITMAGFSYAAGTSDMAMENTLLRQRLDQLDKEMDVLRQTVVQNGDSISPKPVWSNLDIQLYGYLKLDLAYDTSRMTNGNYAQWADSESTNDNDDQFNMTANQTRLGMLINGPASYDMEASGKVEVDFYGAGAAENKAHLMMRHAFLKLDWPQDRFSIIAGQTSDVISPLVPGTINYSVAWWSGNIGYRRPQIRLTKDYTIAKNVDLKLEGALARTIGRENFNTAVTWDTDSGEDAGFPTWQGRVSVTMPLLMGKKGTIGLSAHTGEEEYDLTNTGNNTEFETWSVSLDFAQPICDKVAVKAEVFKGENLNAYLGGIGQGVNTTTLEEINSAGGWVAAALGPWRNKKFNVGIAVDDVESGEVATGSRTLNRSVFGNIICSLDERTEVGFELSHWRTEYRGSGDAESLRAQAALIYRF